MIKLVNCIGRDEFEYDIDMKGVDNESYYIEILNTNLQLGFRPEVAVFNEFDLKDYHDQFSFFWFDDVTEDIIRNNKIAARALTESQSDEIIKLLLSILKSDRFSKLIIHCSAGVSRSGAIASWVYNYCKSVKGVELDFPRINLICPNTHVYSLLDKSYNKQLNLNYV